MMVTRQCRCFQYHVFEAYEISYGSYAKPG
jgi:hypothetical protein